MARKRFGATNNIERQSPVTATGSTAADAARLKRGFQTVTGADGTKGVKLPAANRTKPGDMVVIKGLTNAILKVWPGSTGGIINGLAADAAMSLPTGLIPATFIADTTSQWYTVPLVPS
jgi:hypothetical protein